MKDIILVGFGGHAKSVIDSIEKAGQYKIIGYTDVETGNEYRGYRYLGSDDVLQQYFDRGIKYAFISAGYMGKGDLRCRLYKKAKEIGYMFPAIVDVSAQIAVDVQIGEGCFVGKGAIINSDAMIGKMCIINSGAIVEHDCRVGEFSHISVGTVLCGNVKVGQSAFVGANATVIQGRTVGNGCTIGAGEVMRINLEDNSMYCNNEIVKFSKRGGLNLEKHVPGEDVQHANRLFCGWSLGT